MNSLTRALYLICAAVLFAAFSPAAQACAACFGASDSNLAKGMNMGIFVLLGVIVMVLGGVASFFVFLARKAGAQTAQTLPDLTKQTS